MLLDMNNLHDMTIDDYHHWADVVWGTLARYGPVRYAPARSSSTLLNVVGKITPP
jgi:hypothetical protein